MRAPWSPQGPMPWEAEGYLIMQSAEAAAARACPGFSLPLNEHIDRWTVHGALRPSKHNAKGAIGLATLRGQRRRERGGAADRSVGTEGDRAS